MALALLRAQIGWLELAANRRLLLAAAKQLAILVSVVMAAGHAAFAANSAPAMMTPGQFSVSDTGAFTYKVPIAIPPGTGGMEPSLSLDYSSQSGDGQLGWGWMLSGIPSIGRCPRTYAQDNVHGGVNYDTNDRFCMEGQRLVAISGTYGANGTVYRTEIDGFSQITSYGTAGSGPSYFVVQTKSGHVMEFGNTTDSKVLAQGKTTVRVWAMDKMTDSTGNYLTVTYTNDTTNGQAYPIEIDYTGNAGAGLAPFNSVQFIYNTSRLYPVQAYQAGSMVKNTVLLTNVETFTGTGGAATLVSDYRLAYSAPGSAAAHYELTSVTQCDATTGGNCLKPTTFGWQGSRDTLTLTATPNGVTQNGTLSPGYFQGSGLTDFVTSSNASNCGTWFGTATGFVFSNIYANYTQWYNDDGGYHSHPYNGPLCQWDMPLGFKYYVDLNGDGFTDLLLTQNISPTDKQTFLLLNSGTALNQTGAPLDPPIGTFADFNGDGRTDGLVASGAGWQALLSNGDGTFAAGFSIPFSVSSASAGDFDGDSCADVLQQGASNQVRLSCNPAVASFTVPNFATGQVVLGDFNGDGLTDILVAPISGAATLYLSTGTGLAAPITLSGFTDWGKYAIYVGDWNGDGKDDLLLVASGQTGFYGVGVSHKFFLSMGTGFTAGPTILNTNSLDTTVTAAIADWNNDGAFDVWLQKPSGDTEELFSYVPEAISTVTNGLGITTAVTYDRLNKNTPLYQKCAVAGTFICGTPYPTLSLDGPLYVVSAIASSNGIGGTYNSTYAYQTAQADLHGRGFLGFGQVVVTDSQTGIVQTTTYGQAFPYTSIVTAQTKVSGAVTLNSTTNTYGAVNLGTGTDGVTRYFVELQKTVVVKHDLNGSPMPTATTTYAYDCDTGSTCSGTSPTGYGNATQIVVSMPDGSSKTTTSTYLNDTSHGHWYLGRMLTADVESVVGTSDLTRQTSFTYDIGLATSTGLLTSEIVEPETSADPSLKLETDYSYDAFGNKTAASAQGCVWNGTTCVARTRTTNTAYDTTTYNGQFATTVTNALSQFETWSYLVAFGGPISHAGPNGLTTIWQYDTFGRKTLEIRPDGNQAAATYFYCTTTSCPTLPVGLTLAQLPANAQFYVKVRPQTSLGAQNGPMTIVFYDGLSRTIATDVEGYDGSGTGCSFAAPCWIRTATQYDSNGRAAMTSRPFFVATGVPAWTVNTYDVLGRVTLTTFPDTSTLTTVYCALRTSTTNANGQIRTTLSNDQGLVAAVYESATATCNASGHSTSYVYDAFSNLTTVTDAAGNTVANNTYDIRGRKTQAIDPDKGTWIYIYDTFGELGSQTDARGHVASVSYDALGRVLRRNAAGFASTYVYDTALGMGVGQLASATTGASFTKAYAYDSLGRPSTMTLTEDGTPGVYTYAYDGNSRLQTLSYPSGFTAKYTYTTEGYLYRITDNGTGHVLWTANTRDAELQLLTQTQGNSVVTTQSFDPNTGLIQSILAGAGNSVSNQTFTFDPLGNLTSRTWLNGSAILQENACYDSLNRVTSTLIATGTACTGTGAITVAYDLIGNITKKSDICTSANCFVYGGSGAGPHALTSISGTYNGVVNPTFAYDANGLMTAGAGRTVTATTFDMAAQITDGANTAAFSYDSEHARYKMVTAGVSAGTTYYLNDPSGALEEENVAGGVTTWRDYVMAEGKLVAERFCTGAAPCSTGATYQYFILDHLGSVAVIVSASGGILSQLSYDAWGKRRNTDGSAINCTAGSAPPNGVSRGFTGQEMLDGLCLVNLNARVYDPSLGRFLSADSVVGDPTIPQELNRYSYVINNPLSLTDPGGLCFLGCFWRDALFRDILGIAVAIALEQPEALGWIDGSLGITAAGVGGAGNLAIINGAIVGGISGVVSTGTLKGAALGALQGGLFAEAGNLLEPLKPAVGHFSIAYSSSQFVSHGLVGGLVSVAGGGRFTAGFLAGGVSSFAPAPTPGQSWERTLQGTIESAVLGGAGSELGGGKFANGAVTGAFAYLFNACLHTKCFSNQGIQLWIGYEPQVTFLGRTYYHTFDLLVDGNSFFFFRGGPEVNPRGIFSGIGASEDAFGLRSTGGLGFGDVNAVSGATAARVESNGYGVKAWQYVGDVLGYTWQESTQSLRDFGNYVNSLHALYGPLSVNSNSVSFQAPTVLGFPRPLPMSGYDVPGNDAVLGP